MSEKTNTFKAWMDVRGLKTKDVAAGLHVEEQTIRIWRSSGVPPRRLPHVEKFMREWVDPNQSMTPSEIEELKSHALTIYPTRAQFNRWSRAFKHSTAETMEEWAEKGLDQLAQEWEKDNAFPALRVAEEPKEYGAKYSPSSNA